MFWLSHKPNRKRSKRKVKNQRVPKGAAVNRKPRHVLDAQVLSKRERQLMRSAQMRALLWAMGVVVVIIAVAVTSRRVVQRHFLESPEISLRQLVVDTDGILDRARIVRVARVQENQNLLSVDLEGVRKNLLRMPQIQSVAIKRELPDTLRISVKERFAVAWLKCEDPVLDPSRGPRVLLDEQGVPFVCDNLMKEYTGLPVVSVQRLQSIVPGEAIEDVQVRAALKVLVLSRQALYDHNLEIVWIDAPNAYSLFAKYNNGSKVMYGLEDLETQVANLRAALQHAHSINKSIAKINLLLTKNIPITYSNSSVTNLHVTGVNAPVLSSTVPAHQPTSQASAAQATAALEDVQVAAVHAPQSVPAPGAADPESPRSQRNQSLIRSILGN